MEKIGLYYSA
jgi:Ca2+-binding EF-hand superfamily protein